MAALSGRIAAASVIEDIGRKTRGRGVDRLTAIPAELRFRSRTDPGSE